MKRLFLVLAVAAATATTTLSAQPKEREQQEGRQKPDKEKMAEMFAEKLDLSESQVAEFAKINEAFEAERTEGMKMMKQASDERTKAIVAMLDDDQIAKLLDMKKEKNKRRPKMEAKGDCEGQPKMSKEGPKRGRGRQAVPYVEPMEDIDLDMEP